MGVQKGSFGGHPGDTLLARGGPESTLPGTKGVPKGPQKGSQKGSKRGPKRGSKRGHFDPKRAVLGPFLGPKQASQGSLSGAGLGKSGKGLPKVAEST